MSTFKALWQSFPFGEFPCSTSNKPNFENQCASRLGTCFEKAGIRTIGWPVRRCWQHRNIDGHILAAEEFASALTRVFVPGVRIVEKYSGKEGFPRIRGRTGIVFFKISMALQCRATTLICGITGELLTSGSRLAASTLWVAENTKTEIFGSGRYYEIPAFSFRLVSDLLYRRFFSWCLDGWPR